MNTIPTELTYNFVKEVKEYAVAMKNFLDFNSLKQDFRVKPVSMPKTNIKDISDKYVLAGTSYLVKKGIRKNRANKISSFTFETLLEEVMLEIEK